MVVFCCNGCGESLKKQKVEQHGYSCHSSVSCIDCNVTFVGNDYKKHTTCVTEAERYQGHLYQGKENKGAVKQGSWMDIVRAAAETCKHNAQLKGLLVKIAENDNVPRKKVKFLNFIRNSMHVNNKKLVEQAWEEIEAAKLKTEPAAEEKQSAVVETTSANDNTALQDSPQKEKKKKKSKSKGEAEPESSKTSSPANGETAVLDSNASSKPQKRKRNKSDSLNMKVEKSEKKKKKTKNQETGINLSKLALHPNPNHINGIQPETPGKAKKYTMSQHIQEIVQDKEEISIKKLKRKVLAAYLEYNPHKAPFDASLMFDKKIHKVAGVCVEHGTASKEDLELVED